METELKQLAIGTIKSVIQQNGLQVPESIIETLTNTDNWYLKCQRHYIINTTTYWCLEYTPPENSEDYFIQIEIKTEYNTVIAINIIKNIENKIINYE